MASKQNNFYQRWQEVAKADQIAVRHARLRIVLPAALLVGGAALSLGVLFGMTHMLNTRTAAINAWCADPSNLEPYTQSVTDQALAARYRLDAGVATDVWALLDTYPDVTSGTMARIRAVGGAGISTTFRSYDAATGALAYDAVSDTVIDIPAYVRSLEDTGLFDAVSYTGYGHSGEGRYTINVSCVLAAPAQEGETK